jgi:hypothetical protein
MFNGNQYLLHYSVMLHSRLNKGATAEISVFLKTEEVWLHTAYFALSQFLPVYLFAVYLTTLSVLQTVGLYRQVTGWWIMNCKGYERYRSWFNLWYYPWICLEALRNITINLNHESWSPSRDLNPGPLEDEAGVLTTVSRRSVSLCPTANILNAGQKWTLIRIICWTLPSVWGVFDFHDVSAAGIGWQTDSVFVCILRLMEMTEVECR